MAIKYILTLEGSAKPSCAIWDSTSVLHWNEQEAQYMFWDTGYLSKDSLFCVCPCARPALPWPCDSRVYVTQLSSRIRLSVGLSDLLTGTELKSGCCCSSRSLPPSWELQEELMLSAGDLPSSALLDVVEEMERWGCAWPWACFTNPNWIKWSRGGEVGSALMFMWWLVVVERPEATDLQTVGHTRACWVLQNQNWVAK